MSTIRRFGLTLCLGIGLGIPSLPLRAAKAPSAPSAENLRQLVRERLDAYARRDVEAWKSYVDPVCVCAGSTREGLVKEILARPAPVRNGYGEIRDWSVRTHGEVAIARYRITEFTEIGAQRLDLDLWRTETYLHREGTWKLIGGADVVNPSDPPTVPVAASILDAYVGRYEYAPGLVDTVTREGARLFVQSTGLEKEALEAEDASTFFAPGQGWRVSFVRDGEGTVRSLKFRQNGQDLVARRLP